METTRSCHALRKLHLVKCFLKPVDGQGLAQAIASGAFPRLEDLSLRYNEKMGNEAFTAILKALQEGGCRELKHLNLAESYLGNEPCAMFGDFLSSDHCQQLQSLDMGRAFYDKGSACNFFRSIIAARYTVPCFPAIRSLRIGGGDKLEAELAALLRFKSSLEPPTVKKLSNRDWFPTVISHEPKPRRVW